ncbi:hypothetical protein BDV96DRAFT_582852 [Lophiotrema nucula]|uniref:Tubby C-terminal-like domain-containing protein n=1 Tax=Lophiotrema nucula TaxID=690887 RepID=A0A6A5YWH8_9PLEO|nr:hypothetical protein BDV96DRAFT_582852 [Lophiotrema nucula]
MSSHQSVAPPSLTFVGPDAQNLIYIQDPYGRRRPFFSTTYNKHSKPPLVIYKLVPDGSQQQFATASYNSWSASITVSLYGQEIKMRQSSESLQGLKEFYCPFRSPNPNVQGKLSWKPAGWGDTQDLWNANGLKLARYEHRTLSGSGNESRLEIYGTWDDAIVDMILACGVAMWKESQKDVQGLASVGIVLGKLSGIDGGGGDASGFGGDGGGFGGDGGGGGA